MATKITQRITGFAIKNADDNQQVEQAPKPIEMNENIARPDFLLGSTYKIKPPISDHALYITINDIILNEGTDHEVRRPYEIFIKDRKSTRLNSSHVRISYAVFCLKKKKN